MLKLICPLAQNLVVPLTIIGPAYSLSQEKPIDEMLPFENISRRLIKSIGTYDPGSPAQPIKRSCPAKTYLFLDTFPTGIETAVDHSTAPLSMRVKDS